jgi:hypothetical protein
MKWNNYFYGIINPLFGRDIFLEIVIPMEIANLIHIGIVIPLKNEWNSYYLWNGIDFPKKNPLFYCLFILKKISLFCFPTFSHPPNNGYFPISNLVFVLSLSLSHTHNRIALQLRSSSLAIGA